MIAKTEFTADLLINVLIHEPCLPLFITLLASEVFQEQKEVILRTKEIADPAFKRQAIHLYKPIDSFTNLQKTVQWDKATQPWGRVTHFAIWDAPQNGNQLLLKPTGSVLNVEVGEIVCLNADEFNLYVGSNYTS